MPFLFHIYVTIIALYNNFLFNCYKIFLILAIVKAVIINKKLVSYIVLRIFIKDLFSNLLYRQRENKEDNI